LFKHPLLKQFSLLSVGVSVDFADEALDVLLRLVFVSTKYITL